MENKNILSKLPAALLPWFECKQRQLPWRADRDPYHVWVSEIMLQQTRVEAVKGYYTRFIERLPSVASLAEADDMLLQKLWEGLGYYSRVRNLKKAAIQIMEVYNGIFPEEHEQVLKLPGIGQYTAGAICSIAFDKPTPAVDGNVLRVVSRLTDDSTCVDSPAFQKYVRQSLAEVYPAQAGAFTQALMELGATVCGPNCKPDCEHCPCADFCLGRKNKTCEALPVKKGKAPRRMEEYTVFILRCNDRYALEKRPETGLLAQLWQFPNAPGIYDDTSAISKVEEFDLKPREMLMTVERKHIFTHVEWRMRGVYMEVSCMSDRYSWFTGDQLKNEIGLPTAFRQFLEGYDV